MSPSYVRWRLRKAQKRLVHRFCRRFLQDRDRSTRKSIMVAGAPRSGTTWLGSIIGAQVPTRTMFEPFHAKYVPAFSCFNYFQYMRPSEGNDRLYSFCKSVLSGAIRHPWIDQQVDTVWPKVRVIKEVRANLFLNWLHKRFPDLPIIFVIRHPCAVVLSRMQLGWEARKDLQPLLEQEQLVSDFLGEHEEAILAASSPEAQNAALWCINNLVPLRQFARSELNIVFYEDLCTYPTETLNQVLQPLGLTAPGRMWRGVREPSLTASRQSAIVQGSDLVDRWRQELDAAQVNEIVSVVRAFKLDHLYGDQSTPLVRRLYRPDSPISVAATR